MGFIKVLSFLDFVDQIEHLWHYLLPPRVGQIEGMCLPNLISVKCMAICLEIPSYFCTDLNFQRPISHLILIWDPLKFYHFWTL